MIKSNATYKVLTYLSKKLNAVTAKIKASFVDEFIEEACFYPFIQPIFDDSGENIKGCEVLLRVRNEYGFVSPVAYIDELEKSERMNDITIHLLTQVERSFSKIKNRLPEGFYFSFNIYAPQLKSEALQKYLLQFSETFKGNASLLLEVVERGILKFDETTIDIVDKLMSKGIHFAIDDFGAGTSSLIYIEHMGFSTIKIDRALTISAGGELVYKKVIEAIVSLSDKLGLSVTAEGIENPLQLELLHKAGVDRMQGYYLAKPMDMTNFMDMYIR
ncbi:EAL domain-containing protein [Enterobacter kobei]|uniref:EAL domain-containing protein n=1 Tax=Enterobacter kobei TaxID=208224 RepID=UPI00125B62CB|nr:EAL domain-containing protein [Enterobacter kobei]VAL08369.1 protein YcgG [Enterobacter kobei]